VASTESANIYVGNAGTGTVSVISTATNALTNTASVGGSPVAMAEMPNALKLYVANANPSSVVSVNPINLTLNPPIAPFPGTSWITPVWVVARTDNQRVYVLDQGAGSVSSINTLSDTVVAAPVSVGVGANFMAYDPNLDRIYVTNPATSTVMVLDASTDALQATPLTVANPVSLATLPPYGTTFYVASARFTGTAPSQTVTATVTAFSAPNLSVMTTIPLSSVERAPGCSAQTWSELSVAAAADGSRVYVGNCDAGNTAVIQTSNNTVLLQMEAPTSAVTPARFSVTSASQSGSSTTYGFSPISGPTLRPGMSATISGMQNSGNNGTFPIAAVGSGTFTVTNPVGATAVGQTGAGIALTPQIPILVLANP
jgi:YVTN family beta-propeller protein